MHIHITKLAEVMMDVSSSQYNHTKETPYQCMNGISGIRYPGIKVISDGKANRAEY